MTQALNNNNIHDLLMRVDTQYDETTPEKVKEADKERARQTLESNRIYNLFFLSPQPTSRGCFSSGDTITNSNNTTNIHHTHIYNAPVDSSSDSENESLEGAKATKKKEKTKEEKTTDWKGIAVIGALSTAVVGISLFVYARLSKAVEGAENYLENTKRIKLWAERLALCSDPSINQAQIADVVRVTDVQSGIDQRSVDKIKNYKYSILTSLVGTLAMAGGGITILAAAPALATAGTTAVVAGGVLNSLAVMYAAYNCGMHWSDEKDGRNAIDQLKQSISLPNLIKSFEPNTQTQSHYNTANCSYSQPSTYAEYSEFHPSEAPPSYDESQFIYNQRVNPNQIYPDLSEFIPSAPSYESLVK